MSAISTLSTVRKLTVRVEDDDAEALREMCAINGVTLQAFFQAGVEGTVARFRAEGGRPASEWTPQSIDTAGATAEATFARAREIDARRRRRL